MREILFRGKTVDNGKWIEGYLLVCGITGKHFILPTGDVIKVTESDEVGIADCLKLFAYEVIPETVGQYTDLTDKNGNKIFEGDIVRHNTYDGFDCHSVVRFGKYNQDGSGGEYHPTVCLGWFVEVDNFTVPDFLEPTNFEDYLKTQNLLEVALNCEIIGNIHDNPELLEENKNV